MDEYDFSVFENVEITGADLSSLGNDELAAPRLLSLLSFMPTHMVQQERTG